MKLPVQIEKKWILYFWFLCSTLFLSGQKTESFQHLSRKDGLSQASVFAIAQDSLGFMWFGTRNGLNRFDGYEFKIYKQSADENSLIANDVRSLYFDKQGKELWIGTNAGLSKYRSVTDDFLNYSHSPNDSVSISDNVIRTIFRDSKGRLWIGTALGLNLFDERTNRFNRFYLDGQSAETTKANDVKAILEDRDGRLWFGTANGLFYLSEEKDSKLDFKLYSEKELAQLSDRHIKNILEDENGNLWIGTAAGGVNYWDREKDTIVVYKNNEGVSSSLSHNNVRSMCLDENNNLWVGTFDGLNFLEKGKEGFRRYFKSNFESPGLADKSIRSVFIDQRGSLWLGTYYGGINHSDENYNRFINFKRTPVGNILNGDVVSSFAEDVNGNLWIGTEGDGLNFYAVKNNKFKNYQFQSTKSNTLSSNNVKQLLLDGEQLWIGTFQGGLDLFNIKTEQFKHFKNDPKNKNSLSNDNVYGLRKENDFLWILTYGGGLDILNLKTLEFKNYTVNSTGNSSLSSEYTRVFLETKDKQLWIGTEKGLNKVYKDQFGFPDHFEVYLDKEKIYSLREGVEGNIWIGTFANGLYHFNTDNQSLKHYTISDGLPGNTIFGILDVNAEELWLSTNNGLSKFNPKLNKFTNYNYSNGLENSEYNFNAYYKTKSGNLLFGGINGFTQFDPKLIQPNQFIPSVNFTALKQNNKLVEVRGENSLLNKNINETEKITFNYNEANFSIEFAALDYFSPENNHYAFMLEGIDRDWNYTVGKTEATYTIQRDGHYVFRLKGGNSDGKWNPSERQLLIEVLPPLYRSWWAYLIYLAILGMVILGLIRFVRLQHEFQLEQIAKQKQEELHEVKLRFFTNITHEFRTPLTLILGPLKELIAKERHPENVKKQLSTIERSAQRLLNLVNQILTFRKLATDHEPLKVTHNDFILFLQEIFLPFQETAKLKDIEFQFHSDRETCLIWYDLEKLEKVFFNLLSNAFKFTPNGGKITLSISEHDQYIEVKVIDNGAGIAPELHQQIFKRFYEKANSEGSAIKGTGIGLSISKQMVELHGGKIFVISDPNSEDNKVGTTMVVQLPKGKSHFRGEVIESNFENPLNITTHAPLANSFPEEKAFSINKKKASNGNSLHLPSLLIVEDNAEIRAYIQQIFQDEYEIFTADNGVNGLTEAKSKLPDLIISDVMMPKMDGITFCKKLKTDIEISHIPIILLTARTASLFKIEGLRTGADDYVTKPFDPEELKLRAHNIIQGRQEAREKFSRVLSFDPKEISITSADEIFLENALRIVEKEMDNYEFNVNQFAFELAVSRPLLFTKLKALTGQTPNNFIKTIRLKRAAQLIQTKKIRIAEVAYRVGFKDPKYFRKCFKDQFNTLPSKYGESNNC